MSVWGGRTDLGGQALGWRQRRFRGRCESGDGVDALGGEGGGSDGRIRTTGAQAGAVKVEAASWHGRGGGVGATGRKGGVSGALCPLPHQDKGESETALPAREKRKEEEEREPCSFRFWAARLERRVGLASPRWRLVACGGGAMVTQRMTAKREEGWFGGERGPRRSTRQGRRWCGHSGRP